MPQQGITFGGAFIGLPGAYYQDNVSAAAPNAQPTTPPLLFIGYGWGPKPKTAVNFTNPSDLLNALRGGPASSFVNFLATPSPALNGAQLITFIDASENTQSSLALLNSGATVSYLLTSALYGPPSNQLTAQVGNGSIYPSGSIALTLNDKYAGTQAFGDNLGAPFEMAYVGAATGAVTYAVTSGATSGTFAINSPVSGESVNFTTGPGSFSTVAQLVAAINGTSVAVAQIISSTNGQLPANSLTPTSGIGLTIPTSGVPSYQAVHAFGADTLFWLNNYASNFVTAVSGAGYADKSTAQPVNTQAIYFSGANGVPPVNNDYALALNVGLTVPAWTVFCDSNSVAVQALMAQHCETASSPPYGMWRRGFTGSTIGDSVATTETNALALDSLQMTYSYPGIYRINTFTGANQLYGGLYVAAAAAAIATGNNINLPLTNKVLNGTGVENPGGSPLTQSQLVALQNNGVMCLYTPQQTKRPTILSDVTTWQVDNNIENTSSQQVACRYWLAYSVTNVLFPYVGTIAAPTGEANIVKAVTQLLNSLVYTGTGSSGVLASWVKGSINLVYTGAQELAAITFEAVLVGQNRYITCTASILPLNFTISNSPTI